MTQPSAATAVLDLTVGSLDPTPTDDDVVGTRSARLRLTPETDRLTTAQALALLAAIDREGFGYVGVDVAAERRELACDLQRLGFGLVEQQLTFTVRRLHRRTWSQDGPTLRVVDPTTSADSIDSTYLDFACGLATDGFHFGRYHADPTVDRARLADRYPSWIRSAHQADDTELLILGHDQPVGFLLVQHRGQNGQLLLGATDADRPGPWGHQLYRGALRYLQAVGCRSVQAVAAVDNTPVINVLIELGFTAGRPTKLFRRLGEPSPSSPTEPGGPIELL